MAADQQAPRTKGRGCRRVFATLVVGAVALMAATGAAVYDGRPVGWSAAAVAGWVLGAEVEIGRIGLRPRYIDITRVAIGDPGRPKLVEIDRATVTYALRPADGRHLGRVALGHAVVRFDGADGGNAAFLSRLLGGPPSDEPSTAFLPAHITIDTAEIHAVQPEANLHLDLPRGHQAVLAVALPDGGTVSAHLEGPQVSGRWAMDAVAGDQALSGALRLDFSRGPQRMALHDLAVDFEGLASIRGEAVLDRTDDAVEYLIDVDAVDIVNGALASRLLAPWLPVPVRFDHLAMPGLQAAGSTRPGSAPIDAESFKIEIAGLAVGEPEAPWYRGDLRVSGAARYDGALGAALRVTLGAGQQAAVAFTRHSGGQIEIEAEAEKWPRDALAAVLPAAWQGGLEAAPALEAVSAVAKVYVADGRYRAETKLSPTWAGAPAEVTEIRIDGHGLGDDGPVFDGQVSVLLAKGRAAGPVRIGADGAVAAGLTLDDANLSRWLAAMGVAALPAALDGPLDGGVAVAYGDSGLTLDIDTTYQSAAVLAGAPIALTAQVAMGPAFDAVQISKAVASAEAGLAIRIPQAAYSVEDGTLTAAFEGEVDGSRIGPLVGYDDLYGEARLAGSARYRQALYTLQIEGTVEEPGFAGYYAPGGTVVGLNGSGEYDQAGGVGRVAHAVLTWNGGTTVTLSDAQFSTAPRDASAAFAFETDFAPLVGLRFVEAATANATGQGTVNWRDGATAVAVELDVDAPALLLPGEAALLKGLRFAGPIRYDGAFAGGGAVTAEEVLAGGASIAGVEAVLKLEGQVLGLDVMRADLFDGNVTAQATVDLSAPGPPIRVDAQVTDADLAVFTEEFQPPHVVLTGLAGGTAHVAYTVGTGFGDLRAELASTEQFSLNRDMVKMLLLTSHIADQAGGKQLDRMVEQTIGPAPQRPFERAALSAGLEGEEVVGVALVGSKLLDMNIDINADLKAITAALALRQSDRLSEMGGVAFEVVE